MRCAFEVPRCCDADQPRIGCYCAWLLNWFKFSAEMRYSGPCFVLVLSRRLTTLVDTIARNALQTL